MKSILINASNLHAGGGVQVAVSFIYELTKLLGRLSRFNITIYVSSTVDKNLESIDTDKKSFKNYKVFDVFGLNALNPKISEEFYGYDLVFTIFGPLYLPKKIPNHIIGFAQLWILYPENDAQKNSSLTTQIKNKIKFTIQWFFFKTSACRLVVELPHVKNRMMSFKKYNSKKIDIVNNCISSIYLNSQKWLPSPPIPDRDDEAIKICYVSRAYPHKNLSILLDVLNELNKISNQNFEFFVTLNDDEWVNFSPDYRSKIKNIGPLDIAQCPSFYKEMDGVIFTSLLECFSATPLEAMIMKKPLFASDRDFVRDCCGDNIIYINPIDSEDIAQKINNWFTAKSQEEREITLEKAYQHVLSLPGSFDRALAYIDIICDQLKLTEK